MNELTFGSFVRQKRMEKEMSLRSLAQRLELSPVYMSNIENDLKPAPSQAKLDKLVQIFMLDKKDIELLWDLAAKSRKQRVSVDLPEYIMDRDIVRVALRTAKELDATDKDWQDFIDKLNKRKRNGERNSDG